MTTPPDRPDGFSDSDQQWFDRLSGKSSAISHPDIAREADALRLALQLEQEAVESDPEWVAATSAEGLQQQWEQLRFRAKSEGLLERQGGKWRKRWPVAIGLAAAVLLAAVLVPLQFFGNGPAYDPPPVMRGDFSTRTVRVSQPARAAASLASALRRLGLRPGIYRRGEAFIVDIDLTADQLEGAAPAFRAYGFEPAVGFTRVEFSAL